MTEKRYYVVPRDVALASAKYFVNCHWVDLDDTYVILSAVPRSAEHMALFESTCVVECLPDASDPAVIPDKHADKLVKLGTKKGQNMKNVILAARKIHKQM